MKPPSQRWETALRKRWSLSRWRPARSRSFMMTLTGTGQDGQRCRRWSSADNGAGRRTRYLILMSRNSSIPWITLSW